MSTNIRHLYYHLGYEPLRFFTNIQKAVTHWRFFKLCRALHPVGNRRAPPSADSENLLNVATTNCDAGAEYRRKDIAAALRVAWQRLDGTIRACEIPVRQEYRQSFMKMFWGYAPALDLLRELDKSRKRNAKSVQKRTENESPACSAVGNDGPPLAADNGRTGTTPVVPNGRLVRGDVEPVQKDGGTKEPPCSGRDGEPGRHTGHCPASHTAANTGRAPNADGDYTKPQSSRERLDIFSGLSEETANSSKRLLGEDSVNLLLLGSCDARHIFKTISRLHHHHGHKAVRFYVLDPLMEMVARQLLLLYAALQPPKQLGHKEKVRLLMEITGNTLIRPVTAAWITKASKRLQKMITNESFLKEKMPQVRLDQLRYQERDQLEDICSFWQGRPQNFRIGYHWDDRLRKTLQTRYDLRSNVFDWDYYMVLKDLERGDRICMREYKNWRSSGVAFTWLECEPSVPNVTLATGIFREGGNLLHHGYLGDLKISPYIAYSTEVEIEDEQDMWAKRNDGYVQRSTDVAERHLSRIIYEMMNQEHYEPPSNTESTIHGVIITQVTDLSHVNPEVPPVDYEEWEDPTRRKRHQDSGDQSNDADDTAAIPEDVHIIFLSSKLLRDPGALQRAFNGCFDVVVVASVMAEAHVHADLLGTMRQDGLLLVEGNRFHLLRKTDRDENAAKLVERIQSVGFQLEQMFHAGEHDYARFRVRQ